jgi:hypothetical protein
VGQKSQNESYSESHLQSETESPFRGHTHATSIDLDADYMTGVFRSVPSSRHDSPGSGSGGGTGGSNKQHTHSTTATTTATATSPPQTAATPSSGKEITQSQSLSQSPPRPPSSSDRRSIGGVTVETVQCDSPVSPSSPSLFSVKATPTPTQSFTHNTKEKQQEQQQQQQQQQQEEEPVVAEEIAEEETEAEETEATLTLTPSISADKFEEFEAV